MARLAAGVRRRSDGKLEKRFVVNNERFSVYGNTNKELADKEQDIRERIKNGRLEKTVTVNGKRITLYGSSKYELQEKAEKIKCGSVIDGNNLTLDEYFNEWIQRKAHEVKGNTICTYKACFNTNISPYLGKRKIVEIKRREILNLQECLSKTLSASSCNYMITVIRIILNAALDDGIIKENPSNRIKGIRSEEKASETYHRALTVEEQIAFMNEAKTEYYYELLAFLISTGMRFGEAAALHWQDIDYDKRIIRINKTVTVNMKDGHRKYDIGKPKTAAGEREIPLTDQVVHILQDQKRKNKIVSMKMRDYVFVSVEDKVVRNENLNHTIQSTLKRLDDKGIHIDKITAHALRDTYATRFIEQGGSPQVLKTILGHASLAMTMDLYAHVLPNTKQEEANRINIAI